MLQILAVFVLSFLNFGQGFNQESKLSESEKWKLGWRMIISSMDGAHTLAELQFDSLLSTKSKIDKRFLVTGVQILKKVGKNEKIHQILKTQNDETLEFICSRNLFDKTSVIFELCKPFSTNSKIENPRLQQELITMFINDQVARGGKMDEMISRYKLSREKVLNGKDIASTDEENRARLKVLFARFGFPSKKMVGAEAMHGVFMMIQHSDRDKEWQKSQLPLIKKAVHAGDMDGQNYAYLYDRIKINGGEKQLYGTQFIEVDAKNSMAKLAPTEDLENLDQRRMELGMMPVETYKAFMLKQSAIF